MNLFLLLKLYFNVSNNLDDLTKKVFFPDLPEGAISQLQLIDSRMATLEAESLVGCQVQALSLPNNQLQHIADKAFR